MHEPYIHKTVCNYIKALHIHTSTYTRAQYIQRSLHPAYDYTKNLLITAAEPYVYIHLYIQEPCIYNDQ